MKTDFDHLPAKQQQELVQVRTTLLTEFERALHGGGGGTQPWRRNGKVLKIILFGSYARNDWVDEAENGYLSDFDLLVIVSDEKLTEIADYWYVAEDKILRDPTIGRTVNIIVHTMAEVNQALGRGEYFWVDIIHDGVMLYELPGYPLAAPQPKKAIDAYEMAQAYFDDWLPKIDRSLQTAKLQGSEGMDAGWRKEVAFSLHQAVERSYAAYLLVHTFYYPRSHNIKFLRSLAETVSGDLISAWDRNERSARRRFELLKRAYVEARYSDQFDISVEDLELLVESAGLLRDLVANACRTRVAGLKVAT